MEPSSSIWLPSLAVVAVLTFLAAGASTHQKPPPPPPQQPVAAGPEAPVLPSPTDPTNPRVLITKDRPLPDGYVPPDLVAPSVPSAPGGPALLNRAAATAAEAMFAAARAEGMSIVLVSGYRSQATQAQVHEGHTAALGPDTAATLSAPPGHS